MKHILIILFMAWASLLAGQTRQDSVTVTPMASVPSVAVDGESVFAMQSILNGKSKWTKFDVDALTAYLKAIIPLTEVEVDSFVANNGYVTSESDPIYAADSAQLKADIAALFVDSTRLIQDSILVYFQSGVEVGRDTIAGDGGGGGGATQLNQLTDVTLTSLATGEVLRYNGSLWFNDSIKSLHNIDSLSFNTSASTVTETGSLGWNNEDQTLDLKINGVTLQIGQEIYKLVKNVSGATIQNGQVVRYSGAVEALSRIEANLMVADGTYPAYHTIGVATEDILNGEMGFITNFGAVRGINTTGYTAGDILYVDPTTPGALTNIEPTAPNLDIPVAIALDSKNNGSIFVRPVLFPALNDVQDVAISNITTGQVLRYDGTKWTNSTERDTSDTNEIQYLTFRGDTLELTDDPTNVILPYLRVESDPIYAADSAQIQADIAALFVDSTRLLQDSILVYFQSGVEVGRDTIAGTGSRASSLTNVTPENGALVYILLGQSNAQGTAPNDSASVDEIGPHQKIKIWNPTSNSFEALQVGVNNQASGPGNHGLELGLAAFFKEEIADTVYLVKYAVGDTRISYWIPNPDGADGDGYTVAWDNYIEPALDSLISKNKTPYVSFVWFQGESNTSTQSDIDNYLDSLQYLIDITQTRLSKKIPFYIHEIYEFNSLDEQFNDNLYSFYDTTSSNVDIVFSDGIAVYDQVHYGYQALKTLSRNLIKLIAANGYLGAPIQQVRDYTTSGGSGGGDYILDDYTGEIAAYSLRKLSNTATNAIQIQRASDNTTQDVGFVNDTLDVASINSFCSGTTCKVKILYNQAISGNDLQQNTFANMPIIYENSAVITQDGEAALKMGANIEMTGSITDHNEITAFMYYNYDLSSQTQGYYEIVGSLSLLINSSNNIFSRSNLDNTSNIYQVSLGTPSVSENFTMQYSSTSLHEAQLNNLGSSIDNTLSGVKGGAVSTIRLGQTLNIYNTGFFKEFIAFSNDQRNNKGIIRDNMINFY